MRFYTHLAFGVLFAIFLIPLSFLSLTGLLFGVLFPDIDNSSSKLGRKVKPISWLLQFTVGHRGLFHSLFCGITFTLLFYLFSVDFGVGFFIGYLSHLIADSLTPMGIAWFFPLSKKRLRGPIKTGSLNESILLIFLIICIILLIYHTIM